MCLEKTQVGLSMHIKPYFLKEHSYFLSEEYLEEQFFNSEKETYWHF